MTDAQPLGWPAWALFALFVLACDRAFVWMERRGWIHWRGLATRASRGDGTDARALAQARHDWPALRVDQTVGQALDALRRHASLPPRLACVYLVDAQRTLVGVLPVRRLLSGERSAPLASVMARDVVALPAEATVCAALAAFLERRFLALPIVDERRRLLAVLEAGPILEEAARRRPPATA